MVIMRCCKLTDPILTMLGLFLLILIKFPAKYGVFFQEFVQYYKMIDNIAYLKCFQFPATILFKETNWKL